MIKNNYDLVVIGGGAAGMMAAGIAAKNNKNAKILLIEKNNSLGRKLLITGKGRCNITTSDTDTKKFIDVLGASGKFLYSGSDIT